jgi:hypothetical protein
MKHDLSRLDSLVDAIAVAYVAGDYLHFFPRG